MSLARITKLNKRHSWRLGLAFLLFVQVWGYWPLIPFRRIAGRTTGYVYSLALRLGSGRFGATLLVLLLTCAICFVLCRFYSLKLAVSLGSISLLFTIDVYRVLTQEARPEVLWPTLLWVFLALILLIFRFHEVLRWYSVTIPASFLVFWFYDSIIRLLSDLNILPALGDLWPRPDISYTFGLAGFLGLPGSVYVALPALLILSLLVTYKEG